MSDLLTGHLPPVTIDEMITCVEREIALRRKVYPDWVSKKRLSQAKADEEIRRMEAVATTLRAVKEAQPGVRVTFGQ